MSLGLGLSWNNLIHINKCPSRGSSCHYLRRAAVVRLLMLSYNWLVTATLAATWIVAG